MRAASADVRLRRGLLGLAGVLILAYGVYVLVAPQSHLLEIAVSDVGYNAALGLVAAVCLLRGLRGPAPTRPWLALGVGVGLWAAADSLWTALYVHAASPPTPSVADPGYLGFYLFAYAAVLLVPQGQGAERRASPWLDGVVCGTAVAALAAAVVVQQVQSSLGGSFIENATNLAYPLADALLLALVLARIATGGARLDRMWGSLAGGLVVLAISDSAYVVEIARGTYQDGLIDLGWPVGMLLLGLAATSRPSALRRSVESHRVLVLPVSFGLLSLGLLVWDHWHRLGSGTLALAAASVLAMLGRLAVTYRENLRILARIREDSLTDQLTSLGNRRRFIADLDHATASGEPHTLLLFDLNGFKPYNDTFGHPAGDALLAQLGRQLAESVAPAAVAYRMGGDEFCVLHRGPRADATERAADAALTAHGEAFDVTAAFGRVELPAEAGTGSEALAMADTRMYANKHGARRSPGRQTTDALMRAVGERHPELDEHVRGVTGLARRVGILLGLEGKELEDVVYTAELHDIGKIAIPDAILGKPGALTRIERDMIDRHTLIGERIVAAAPALRGVSRLVRSSHERWDGAGYPDGLTAEEIPLGSRVVAVCDAFEAMTSGRPYRERIDEPEAIAELRRCAGTQFDPDVVTAMEACLRELAARPVDGPVPATA